MIDIDKIFENTLVTEDTGNNVETARQLFLLDVFTQNDISLATIINWELQIVRFIRNLNLNGAYASSINIEQLMIDNELNIIGSSIKVKQWNHERPIETAIISSINNLHTSIFKYILEQSLSKQKRFEITILYVASTYFYASSIDITSYKTIVKYMRSIERFRDMTEYGFINDICNLIHITK